METDKYVFFYGHKPNPLGVHIFSQWFPINFTEKFDSKTIVSYVSAEQYMMAHKALLFGDDYYYSKIIEATDQANIKKYGRLVRGFNETIWDQHKFDIVVNGNKLKFGQHPDLMQRLLQTGTKTIVEASPYDKVWGIGLSKEDAIKTPENKWPGENLLGRALMAVRDEN